MKHSSPGAEGGYIERRVERAATDSAIRRLHRMIADERAGHRAARRFGMACLVAAFYYYMSAR